MKKFEEKDYNEKVNFSTWKKIIHAIMSDKKNLIWMVVTISLLAILDVLHPILNSTIIDKYFTNDNVSFDNAEYYILIYIGLAILYFICTTAFLIFTARIENDTAYILRKQAYENIQKLSFSYYDVTSQGWLMARMTSDASKLAGLVSWGLVDFLWGVLTMVGILIALLITNLKLGLIVICVLPFMLIIAMFIRRKILVSYRSARKINSQITASYNEGFMGSITTKSLVIEENNEKEFVSLTSNYRKSALKAHFFSSLFGPTLFFLGYVAVAVTLYEGGNMVLDGLLTVGTLYLFIDYSIRFFDPIMNITRILSDFQQAQASAERIVSLIEEIPEIQDSDEVKEKYGDIFNPKKENWESIDGDVEFKDVTFKYNTGETVLKDFNLKIKQGSSVALVGHTGSGKSTLVNLICRFYEPTKGEILIDGVDYRTRSIGWLHSNIGYVLQTPQLFSGTIKENIRYGKLDATDEEIIEAAKIVDAHEFIEKLDNGYETDVGEGGNKLSLGQRQLISFARAIISNPRILVLDEATSSIDTETEYKIQQAIDKVMEGRTTFAIAHRLSTIVNCDLILVMKDGKIVEQGNHKELLAMKGYYFTLYKNQFMQDKENEINSL